jgi:hypothetical protein
MTSRDGTWTARFYTPKLQWLDKIEISLVATDGGDGSGGGGVTADAWSKSLGCCPTSVPGALLGGWLCVCFPFNDHGKNLKHLTELKGLLVEVRRRKTFFASDARTAIQRVRGGWGVASDARTLSSSRSLSVRRSVPSSLAVLRRS